LTALLPLPTLTARRRLALLAGSLATALLLIVACTAFFFLRHAHARKPDVRLSEPISITVTARPLPFLRDVPERSGFGKLTWLGSLELRSPARPFGGFSALALSADGRQLVALSDTGLWLRAEIVLRNGRPAGLKNARLGPLLGRGGQQLTHAKRNNDAEALAFLTPGAVSGPAYVGFEQRHRVDIYDFSKTAGARFKASLPLPARARSAHRNSGIEALALLRGPHEGTLLVLTENHVDERGNHIGWLITKGKASAITLRRRDEFSITDAAALPDGDVVVLERRFRFSDGVRMRLRRISAQSIRPGALLDGEILLAADSLYAIDNMEGLSVHRDAQGRTILTLISDDNYNPAFQSTLLIQFALP